MLSTKISRAIHTRLFTIYIHIHLSPTDEYESGMEVWAYNVIVGETHMV